VADLSRTNAWAVGIRGTVEHWDGTAWSNVTVPSPNPSYPAGANLNAITAISASDIWAVGSFTNTSFTTSAFALHYNGSPTLNAVAARLASDVYAVGFNEPSVNGGVQQGLILRWSGSAWSADADPTAGTFSPLYGAATLPGATSEWAAGINGADQALVLSHG
jgi:hypothetical protein